MLDSVTSQRFEARLSLDAALTQAGGLIALLQYHLPGSDNRAQPSSLGAGTLIASALQRAAQVAPVALHGRSELVARVLALGQTASLLGSAMRDCSQAGDDASWSGMQWLIDSLWAVESELEAVREMIAEPTLQEAASA